jgi:hypothetical protein
MLLKLFPIPRHINPLFVKNDGFARVITPVKTGVQMICDSRKNGIPAGLYLLLIAAPE